MEQKSLVKNYFYNLVYQILIVLLPFITTSHLAKALGTVGNGIYAYVYNIVNYFILFGSLGISMYGQREIAYLQNDREKIKKIFLELIFFRVCSIFLVSILYYFLFMRIGEYVVYYRIMFLEIIAVWFDISWLFQGLENFKSIVLRNIIVRIVSVFFVFMFVKEEKDLFKLFFIYAIADLIR